MMFTISHARTLGKSVENMVSKAEASSSLHRTFHTLGVALNAMSICVTKAFARKRRIAVRYTAARRGFSRIDWVSGRGTTGASSSVSASRYGPLYVPDVLGLDDAAGEGIVGVVSLVAGLGESVHVLPHRRP